MKKQVFVILGLAVDRDGKFLITKRYDPKVPKAHLRWQIPGGKIEYGENPEETLHREMLEEVGVEVKIISVIPHIDTAIWEIAGEETQAVLAGYLVKIADDEEVSIAHEETADYAWIKAEEIEKYHRLPATDGFLHAARAFLCEEIIS